MESAPVPDYRREYLEWKGWTTTSFGRLTRADQRYFDAEMRRIGLATGKPLRCLEIGFGNGRFLAYARDRGWEIAGTELNPELAAVARANQFAASCTDNLREFAHAQFDLVVAFDVLEHVPQPALLEFLRDVLRVLKPDGAFLARFPNGDSPFGLINQNGDVTHVTTLGSGKVAYFASELRASLAFIGGEAEPILAGSLARSAYRMFAIPARRLLNLAIRLLFFPNVKVAFCSANMVIVLRAGTDTQTGGGPS